jgi:hypothetical protein
MICHTERPLGGFANRRNAETFRDGLAKTITSLERAVL